MRFVSTLTVFDPVITGLEPQPARLSPRAINRTLGCVNTHVGGVPKHAACMVAYRWFQPCRVASPLSISLAWSNFKDRISSWLNSGAHL